MAVSHLVHVQERLIDSLLKLQAGFNRLKGRSLDEVSELGISMAVSHLVHVQERLIDSLLKLQAGFNCLKGRSPFVTSWFCDLPENNPATSLILVVNKHLGMFLLFLTCFTETLSKSKKGDVFPGKVGRHREVDIGSVELHVDLLVDKCLT